MNRKGQVVIVRIMIYIAAIIFAIAIIPFMKENLGDVRSADQLNCSSDDLTTGVAMTCLEVDLILPIFIGVILGTAGQLIVPKP